MVKPDHPIHLKKRLTAKRMGEILLERGILNEVQLEKVLAISGELSQNGHNFFGEILLSLELASEEDIIQAFTAQYSVPYLPLEHYQLNPDVVALVPEWFCRKYHLMPVDVYGRNLTVAAANPLNHRAFEELRYFSDLNVMPFIATNKEIVKTINRYYSQN
ncbi:MAG TPA: hypothetical protein P5110_06195 [Candidatus Omnitrophota bacterium]|nr:hypothetical protein [Candidatus Omnitrophota bacterium]HRZ15083.1 hypothetical protein [Candidatus Omnitrophota bacterium]